MDKGKKEIISVRFISSAFTLLALAIFKPFGLVAWQWQSFAHLLAIFAIGVGCCFVTEGILKYLIKKPRSSKHGIGYVIHRNLWFQLINTPLVSLAICLYRHFAMSAQEASNLLSWGNFLETLVILAFCSFAIGLYWRFKYRSRFLAKELEETQLLNTQLKELQFKAEQRALAAETAMTKTIIEDSQVHNESNQASTTLTLTGTTSESITLQIHDLLYIETVGNYVKVYHFSDRAVRCDMLRATSKQMEDDLGPYPMIVRCHRAFLVNLEQVEQILSKSGSTQLLVKHCHSSLPVSRSHMAHIKEAVRGL